MILDDFGQKIFGKIMAHGGPRQDPKARQGHFEKKKNRDIHSNILELFFSLKISV